MTFVDSLRVQVKPTWDERFRVFKDGEEIATFDTEQEANDRARIESSRIEGL